MQDRRNYTAIPSRRAALRSCGIRIFCIAACCALFFVQTAIAQQAPSQILNQYRAQRVTWMTNVWPFANNLFFWLALIEFTWSAAIMMLEKTDLQSWTAALIRRIMWIGAFYALLLNGRTWIPTIVDSFNILGQQASGAGPMSPSDVFMRGLNVAGALMDGASSSAFLKNPGTSLACVVAAAMTVLAFIGITIQFVVAMVESYIIVAAGVIFLGFGGSRWTAPYVERYIGLGVANGVKIMLLYLLIGVGMDISLGWIPDAQAVSTSTTPAMNAFEVMGAALIFLMLCWQIPKLFSAVLGGAPALTGGDLLGTGTSVVAGAAAVGSLAAGGVALAARGATAISGVGAAAGAGGSGAGSSAAGVGAAGRGGGAAGGGVVPPPSSPSSGPSGNGGPRQPNPPSRNGGSGGASADVTGVGSSSSGGSSPVRNGSGHNQGSNGNGTANSSSIASALSSVGGDHLTGSGFEGERPASGFTPTSSSSSPSPVRSGFVSDALLGTDSVSSAVPPITSTAGELGSSGANAGTPAGRSLTSTESGQNSPGSTSGVVSDVRSVRTGSASPQRPAGSRRERIGSAARRTDRVLSRAAGRLRGVGNQFGVLPSDAAPHTPPPRMPIEHHD
jgi:type IV secretion system protein TrbL